MADQAAPPPQVPPVPQWVQTMFERQQELLERIQRNDAVNTLRQDILYKFSPSDSPDDLDYFTFSERITDLVLQYGERRVLASLLACLENQRAKTWYASLEAADKALLRTSTANWQILLKRDFGIPPYRAKQLAARERFSFAQNKPILPFLEKKIALLRISGTLDVDLQCHDIRDSLMDPEFRTALRLKPEGNTLTAL